jgi:hypothetical protein
MTTNDMLFFAGRVLGPALIARDVAERLRAVPTLNERKPADAHRADRLLAQVFPEGLPS